MTSTKNTPSSDETGGPWSAPMGRAYAAGKADGKREAPADVARGAGFDGCYWQGYSHGRGECCCPSRLSAAFGRCPCCGNYKRRTPDDGGAR